MKALHERNSFRSFEHRNFRLVWSANLVSNIGSWVQRVAQDWLVLQLTGSGTALGVVTALQFAPALLFSLHGGALADRLNKRWVLMATNAAGGLIAGALGLLVITEQVKLWHVFVLAALLGSADAIGGPVRLAFVSELVSHHNLPNAVSLNSANFNFGRLIGPGLSGLLIAAFGTGPSFMINAASFFAIVVAMMFVRESELHDQDRERSTGNVREALAYIRARADLSAVMITVFFLGTFGLNFNIFNALMATKEFHKAAVEYGALGSIVAIGSLTGALSTTRLERFRNAKFVMRGAIAFGVALIVISRMPTFGWYAMWLPVVGFCALVTMVTANSVMQLHTDPAIRGRVMGWYLFVFSMPFGQLILGWLAEQIGIRNTIAVGGAITGGVALLALLLLGPRAQAPDDYSVTAILDVAALRRRRRA